MMSSLRALLVLLLIFVFVPVGEYGCQFGNYNYDVSMALAIIMLLYIVEEVKLLEADLFKKFLSAHSDSGNKSPTT